MSHKNIDFDFNHYLDEYNLEFAGWDFSYIAERMKMYPMEWSYRAKILPFLEKTQFLLDMGTGGGEFLSRLTPIPKFTFATEGFLPNIPIARNRLKPLGITVKQVDEDLYLDFDNDYFDLIINRHEEYSVLEVNRILKRGGYFITQQVGGKDNLGINELLAAPYPTNYEEWNLNHIVQELEGVGFKIIEKMECYPITRIFDIGALLYYLKAIPWQIEKFELEKFKDALFELHQKIREQNYIDVASHRILVVSKKE